MRDAINDGRADYTPIYLSEIEELFTSGDMPLDVALVDLKTDRERQKLLLQRWTWLGKDARRSHKKRIEEALHRFERFQFAR